MSNKSNATKKPTPKSTQNKEEMFWDNNAQDNRHLEKQNTKTEQPKNNKSTPAPVTQTVVKNVYAKGPIHKDDSKVNTVQAFTNDSETNDAKPVKTTTLLNKQALMSEMNDSRSVLLRDFCVDSKELQMKINQFKSSRRIDPKTGQLVAHLLPILISYWDNDDKMFTKDKSQYFSKQKIMFSREFTDAVKKYYLSYKCHVKFDNDRVNQICRLLIYPEQN